MLPKKTKAQLIEELKSLQKQIQRLKRSEKERKNAEKIILQAKEEWENTFDTIKDLIFITDGNGVVRRINRSLANKLGVQPHDMIGRTCWEMLRCEHKGTERCSLAKIQQGISVREHEVEISPLGMWVMAHVYATYTPSKELDYIIHTYRDITEHKMLQEQLFQLQKMEAINTLAAGVAHEFNNILTGIIGNLSLTKSQLSTESEEYRFVERAYNSAERASDIIKSLLAFTSKLSATDNLISVNDAIFETTNLLRVTTDPRIKIVVHTDKDLWKVKVDFIQINHILMELLRNARAAIIDCLEGLFRYECGEKKSFIITISAENTKVDEKYYKMYADARPGEFVLITISDNGPGMDKETQRRIFEPFFTTREVGKGKGLGLATVYGIVKQYNGWINIYSERGIGTTFKIYLPRAKPANPTPLNTS
ncbi:MAG: PAS domain S-box protein [Nitrospirae bacterium]|nr:PAS domain S-box protein [Nitrospirota bacterium]